MRRQPEQEPPDNHERWLVSYADFITLLFAFFVVMYAISSVNESKYRVLSNALVDAFGSPIAGLRGTVAAAPGSPDLPLRPRAVPDAMRREKGRMTEMARDILQVLEPLVKQGKVRVTQTSLGLNVEINDSVLFAPGQARLSALSSRALIAIAALLQDDDHAIQVEGHTDTQAIRSEMFPSNWELSAARAGSVVRLLADNGIAEDRLTAVGHGTTQAIADNRTAAGRQRNRRVVIMVLSHQPEQTRDIPLQAPAVH
jgi:chemotaxis protein MotB